MSTTMIVFVILAIAAVGLAIGLGVYFGTQSSESPSTSPSSAPSVTISKPVVPVDAIESLYAFIVESPGKQSSFVNVDTQKVVSTLAQSNYVKSSFVLRNTLAVAFFDVPQMVQFFNLSNLGNLSSPAGQITNTGQRLIDMCVINDNTIALLIISTDNLAVRSLQLYNTNNFAIPVLLDSKPIRSDGAYVRYLNSKLFIFSTQVSSPVLVVNVANLSTLAVQPDPIIMDPLAPPTSLIKAIYTVPGDAEILVVASVNDFVPAKQTTSILYTVNINSASSGVVNNGAIADFRADQVSISPNGDLIFLAAIDNTPGVIQIYNVATKASDSVSISGISPQPIYVNNQLHVFNNTNGSLHMTSFLGARPFTLTSDVDFGVKLTGASLVVAPFMQ